MVKAERPRIPWCELVTMSFNIVSCCTYLTDVENGPWRRRDYDAHDFVFAVKGRRLNGYAQVPVRGTDRRLDNDNRDDALAWFGQMIADVANNHRLIAPVALVPVPNSDCAVDSQPGRTLTQAEALAAELNRRPGANAIVLDALRWFEPIES